MHLLRELAQVTEAGHKAQRIEELQSGRRKAAQHVWPVLRVSQFRTLYVRIVEAEDFRAKLEFLQLCQADDDDPSKTQLAQRWGSGRRVSESWRKREIRHLQHLIHGI
jgi:hypothetical protein